MTNASSGLESPDTTHVIFTSDVCHYCIFKTN